MWTRMGRIIFLLGILAVLPLTAADFTAEPAGEIPAEGLPEDLVAMLSSEGVRVKGPDGKVVAEFWGRKTPFEGEPVSGFGIRFETIPEGALVGLARFPESGSDFREQRIPSGVYSMRFGLHPEDGNHMGAAPSRDFFLLSPAAKDTEPAKNYDFDDLIELSYAVGNPHPTIARAELGDGDGSPNVWENDSAYWIVDLKVAGEVIGIVVHGHADE